MALLKDEEQKDGNVASYWIIVSFPFNRIDPSGFVLLYGYASESIRKSVSLEEQEEAKCATKKIYITPREWNRLYDRVAKEGKNIYTELYNFCKNKRTKSQRLDEDPFFLDAESDHEALS